MNFFEKCWKKCNFYRIQIFCVNPEKGIGKLEFIWNSFKLMIKNLILQNVFFLDDGVIAADEFRYNCVSRIPVNNVDILDESYQNLLNVCKFSHLFSISFFKYFLSCFFFNFPHMAIRIFFEIYY